MKGVFITWIASILLLAGCAYIINTDDSGEYVKMDGTILGKAVLRGYGKLATKSTHCPAKAIRTIAN